MSRRKQLVEKLPGTLHPDPDAADAAAQAGVSGSVSLMLFSRDSSAEEKERVAVKRVSVGRAQRLAEDFARETAFYKSVPPHPNICGFVACGRGDDDANDGEDGLLVLERATGGSALEKLREDTLAGRCGRASAPVENDWLRAVADAARAMAHCHANGFVVCDAHFGNLLRSNERGGLWLLADFGLAQRIKERKPTLFAGHRRLIAPEVAVQKLRKEPLSAALNPAADVYMLGSMLYQVLVGFCERPSFPDIVSDDRALEMIASGETPKLPDAISIANASLTSLLYRAWSRDPAKRPTASEVADFLEELCSPAASVPSKIPRLKRLPSGIAQHTANLYVFDEVMSILQKQIRRGDPRDACFWALELEKSGLGTIALDRLAVILSEDVSLSVPTLPIAVLGLRKKYFQSLDSGDREGAQRALLETTTILSLVPKCQMANNACGASLGFVQDAIKAGNPLVTSRWERFVDNERSECEPLIRLRELMERCSSSGDSDSEDQALCLLQRLYMGSKERPGVWLPKLWDFFSSLGANEEEIGPVIDALREMRGVGNGERLRIFHCFLLFVHRSSLSRSAEIPRVSEFISGILPELMQVSRHPRGMPDFAIDRHTTRGKGGKMDARFVRGRDTTEFLSVAASTFGIDVSGWSAEEKAKSHGLGKTWRRHQGVTARRDLPTLIEEFFDVGTQCSERVELSLAGNTAHSRELREKARSYYLWVEQTFSPLDAKSSRIIERQLEELANRGIAVAAAAAKEAPDEPLTTTSAVHGEKKPKLRTSQDVMNRIIWDHSFDAAEWTVVYKDRFDGLLEVPLREFDKDEIPWHRIYYFKRNGEILWDRLRRIDKVF